MTGDLNVKVVLVQTVLHGTNHSDSLQRVATVYIDDDEYRVYAPAGAKGPSVEWTNHLSVRQLNGPGSEVEIRDALGILSLKAVKEELEKDKRDSRRAEGSIPTVCTAMLRYAKQGMFSIAMAPHSMRMRIAANAALNALTSASTVTSRFLELNYIDQAPSILDPSFATVADTRIHGWKTD